MNKHVKALLKRYGMDRRYFAAKGLLKLAELRVRQGAHVALRASRIVPSGMPLDILVPAIDKDADVLPYVIDSARRHILHPIRHIFVVAPPGSLRIAEMCRRKDCQMIDETTVGCIAKKDIHYAVQGEDRSGWLYQQYLKLQADQVCTQPHCLVIDADTVFVQDQVFERNGRMLFDVSDEHHTPYYRTMERLGFPYRCTVSFVSHHALLDMDALRELRQEIERRNGNRKWHEAILEATDRTQMSGFSEYELYGHFMLHEHSDRVTAEYWRNVSVPRAELRDVERLKSRYGRTCKTISFHSYRT